MDYSPQGFSVHEIFQARILKWVVISFSRGASQHRDRTRISCTAGRFFTDWATREVHLEPLKSIKQKWLYWSAVLSHSVVSDSLRPWTVAFQALLSPGILQARMLEWVAIPSSRGSSQPRDRTQVSHIVGGFFTDWATREGSILIEVSDYMVPWGNHLKVKTSLQV